MACNYIVINFWRCSEKATSPKLEDKAPNSVDFNGGTITIVLNWDNIMVMVAIDFQTVEAWIDAFVDITVVLDSIA